MQNIIQNEEPGDGLQHYEDNLLEKAIADADPFREPDLLQPSEENLLDKSMIVENPKARKKGKKKKKKK